MEKIFKKWKQVDEVYEILDYHLIIRYSLPEQKVLYARHINLCYLKNKSNKTKIIMYIISTAE